VKNTKKEFSKKLKIVILEEIYDEEISPK